MANSLHSRAREFAAYVVEQLMRELRDDVQARQEAATRLRLSGIDSNERITREFLTHATVYLDGDGEIRITLPPRRRRNQ